jgi:hypothetical protein
VRGKRLVCVRCTDPSSTGTEDELAVTEISGPGMGGAL